MKKFLLSLLGILVMYITNAQDTIVLRNNTIIKAKVIEIGTKEIKYKKIENLDGPTYNISRSEVQMIKYENGSTDTFTADKPVEKTGSQKTPAKRDKSVGMVYAALSVPLGRFEASNEGGAKLGWGLGFNGSAGSGSSYFSYQVSYANHKYDFSQSGGNGNFYSLTGDYNVWHFLVGLGTRTEPASTIFYMNVMGGLNYTVLTGILAQAGYSSGTAFGFSIGLGVVVNQTFSLGMKYLDSNTTFENSQYSGYDVEQKISMFQLVCGFHF